jgi:hypothetical protein
MKSIQPVTPLSRKWTFGVWAPRAFTLCSLTYHQRTFILGDSTHILPEFSQNRLSRFREKSCFGLVGSFQGLVYSYSPDTDRSRIKSYIANMNEIRPTVYVLARRTSIHVHRRRHIHTGLLTGGIPETTILYVGSEVLTAVVMKSAIFWDITPCSPLKVSRRFGRTYRLHFQGQRISRARNQRESRCHAGFLLGLFFDPENGGDMFHRNVG